MHVSRVHLLGFPHSDIFGSKVARHLPEAYRRHATSFIAFSSQGIHHTPLYFPLGNLRTACYLPTLLTLQSHIKTKYIHRWVSSVKNDLSNLKYEIFKQQSFWKEKPLHWAATGHAEIASVWLWPRVFEVIHNNHSVRISILVAV